MDGFGGEQVSHRTRHAQLLPDLFGSQACEIHIDLNEDMRLHQNQWPRKNRMLLEHG